MTKYNVVVLPNMYFGTKTFGKEHRKVESAIFDQFVAVIRK